MYTINFNIKFDKNIDDTKSLDTIEKFWDHFFTKNLSDILVHQVDFSENWARNLIKAKSEYMTQEKFDGVRYNDYRETAKNTTNDITKSIVFNLIKEEDNIQNFHVLFNLDYKIPENCGYCSNIEYYLKTCIISSLQEQTEMLVSVMKKMKNERGLKLHLQFSEQLKEMEQSLQINPIYKAKNTI